MLVSKSCCLVFATYLRRLVRDERSALSMSYSGRRLSVAPITSHDKFVSGETSWTRRAFVLYLIVTIADDDGIEIQACNPVVPANGLSEQ